jgi:hypothetical protein
MSINGCVLAIFKRERELNTEDKTLLNELSQQYTRDEEESDKDVLIKLLKRSKREDELFNEHRYKDLERQYKRDKSLEELIKLTQKEKERIHELESAVFQINKEKNELEKRIEKMREEVVSYNTSRIQDLYALFEKHKLPEAMLEEFNTLVNELFMSPLKFFYNKK